MFEFFLMMGAAIIFGSMGVAFGAAILGEVAELVANSIRFRAYKRATEKGLSHDDAVKEMDKAFPFMLAEDVRATLMVIGYVALFVYVAAMISGV